VAADQKYVLPPDVLVRSGKGLREELRSRLGLGPDEHVLARPHSRELAAVVDDESAGVVELFRTPHTILEAVIAHSEARALEPRETLRRVYPTLADLVNGGLLVQAGSVLEAPIQLSYREGDRLGGFDILAPVHLATDTEVYLARLGDGRFIALKVGRPGQEGVMRLRLRAEAQALARIGGRVAPQLLEDGSRCQVPHLALAWCQGVDADAAAAELRVGGEEGRRRLLGLVGRILRAYAALHAAGILHGDVGSRNVVVDGREEVTLIDFGLARVDGREMSGAAPTRGLDLTTEPEAAAARLTGTVPELTATGEQYSLAALVYLLLTGSERQRFSMDRDRLLGELAAPAVQPFAEHGVTGLSSVEVVVRQALSRDPSDRFESVDAFRNGYEDAAARDLAGVVRRPERGRDSEATRTLLDTVLARLLSPGYEAELDEPPASAAAGAAGIAYALLRIATVREDEHLLAHADLWAHRAAIAAPVEGGGFREGAAFVRFVEARVAAARGDETALPTAVEAFLASCPTGGGDFDVFAGGAGALLACATLLDALPRGGADEARALLDAHGEKLASHICLGMGADPEASTISALGAAHGVAGMLFSVLRWHESADRPLPSSVDASLRWLAGKAIPVGRGMFWPTEIGAPLSDRTLAASWCNGAAGHVALWALADRLLADRYWEYAEAAAWFAWEDGGVVPDLCCGLAGRGYAMLSLYRHTQEQVWLTRARQLAARSAHHVRDSLQPRDSLFHGELGIATLVADLERPDFGGMPLYEAEA